MALVAATVCFVLFKRFEHKQLNSDLDDAVQKGDIGRVRSDLQRGADPNTKHIANENQGFFLEISYLFSSWRSKEIAGTPVILLALHRPYSDFSEAEGKFVVPEFREAVVADLIKSGANVNCSYEDGTTPLMVAVYANKSNLAELMVAHHADVNAHNQEGTTPLFCCVSTNNVKIAKLLIEHGADGTHKDVFGYTPLSCALEQHRLQLASILESNARPRR